VLVDNVHKFLVVKKLGTKKASDNSKKMLLRCCPDEARFFTTTGLKLCKKVGGNKKNPGRHAKTMSVIGVFFYYPRAFYDA